ncbi:hypothetical protein F4860DRAFT_295899 [Xylaria cubensis]|nr:hypothetical protein F4860DRAFT_295899 [Xylaria cubensis]
MACKKRAWRLLARIQYTASACKMVRAESCMRGRKCCRARQRLSSDCSILLPLSTLAICSKFHRVQVHTYMEDAYTFASKCKISHIVALHTQMSTTLPASGKGKRLIEFRCEVTRAGKHLLLESGTGMSVDIILWSRTMLAHNTRTLPPLSSDSAQESPMSRPIAIVSGGFPVYGSRLTMARGFIHSHQTKTGGFHSYSRTCYSVAGQD